MREIRDVIGNEKWLEVGLFQDKMDLMMWVDVGCERRIKDEPQSFCPGHLESWN